MDSEGEDRFYKRINENSQKGPSQKKNKPMSLYDLISKIVRHPNKMKEETYQLINKNPEKDNDQV